MKIRTGRTRPPVCVRACALIPGIVTVLALLLVTPGYGQAPGGGPGGGAGGGPGGARASRDNGEAPYLVASRSERVLNTTVAGRLRPALSVPHAATVNGFVTAIHVQVGDHVPVGAPLYTIERDETLGSYAPVVMRSRVAGVVSELPVRLWNEVRSGDTGAVIIDPGRLLLETYITDKDADQVEAGMAVEAVTATGRVVPGRLLARSPEPDYQTGLFRLRFEFTPDTGENLAGRFVTVDLPVVRLEGIFVAQDLLVRRYGQYYLWVITAQDTLRLQQVSLGTTVEEEILVTSGLTPGMRYLRNPTGREREGMPAPGSDAPARSGS
ncbi:MAG: HlyD family efflux transporter periplasmic adaptor subunit [Spirochaetaceae bacterium]|nr:MAG: HlyD family efflux transporter periplasmic adaptor subunit [Spirochaetaceae bacterium]